MSYGDRIEAFYGDPVASAKLLHDVRDASCKYNTQVAGSVAEEHRCPTCRPAVPEEVKLQRELQDVQAMNAKASALVQEGRRLLEQARELGTAAAQKREKIDQRITALRLTQPDEPSPERESPPTVIVYRDQNGVARTAIRNGTSAEANWLTTGATRIGGHTWKGLLAVIGRPRWHTIVEYVPIGTVVETSVDLNEAEVKDQPSDSDGSVRGYDGVRMAKGMVG